MGAADVVVMPAAGLATVRDRYLDRYFKWILVFPFPSLPLPCQQALFFTWTNSPHSSQLKQRNKQAHAFSVAPSSLSHSALMGLFF